MDVDQLRALINQYESEPKRKSGNEVKRTSSKTTEQIEDGQNNANQVRRTKSKGGDVRENF